MIPRIACFVSLLVLSGATFSQQPAAAPASENVRRGQVLAYTCHGCHGIPNYNNVYPTYRVPKLQGQRPEYLVAALKAYKSGERSHGTMHAQAASMSDQDMLDVAAYLAGPQVLTESTNDIPAHERPKASEVCIACHGTNGVGITADYPTLGGQHRDYLVRALLDYQRGGRKNAVMAGMAANLTREDIEALATFYSEQRPKLQTLRKRDLNAAVD